MVHLQEMDGLLTIRVHTAGDLATDQWQIVTGDDYYLFNFDFDEI